MILQALHHYYQRKIEVGDELAPFGFERKGIEFILLLDVKGNLINIEDVREQQGKKRVAQEFLVPQGEKKTSGIKANLLWDNLKYVLGVVEYEGLTKKIEELKRKELAVEEGSEKSKLTATIKKLEVEERKTSGRLDKVKASHNAFVERIQTDLGGLDDQGVNAVLLFLRDFHLSQLEQFTAWSDLLESSGNLTFRLQKSGELICQRVRVISQVKELLKTKQEDGVDLVSGEMDEQQSIHPSIKGVWGAQSSGANIVSFNLDAFRSWNKKQGLNAPIGKYSVFSYTTAINHLLRRDSPQRIQIGDTSTVFWAEKQSQVETDLPLWLSEPNKDDPDQNSRKIKSLYESVRRGGFSPDDESNRFYLLGLAPNASRIAIRFWQVGTVAEISRRIVQHFDDLKIDHAAHEPPYPSLFRLLVHIATLGKADNIPPNLGGDFMRAIINGMPYPHTLFQAAIRRIRAERTVDYYRVALIKAVLNRRYRANQQSLQLEKEITVSLDKERTEMGYRLGRLFSVLESIQDRAQGDINAGIRDRYYGSASSSPRSVFSTLMKLKNHHLAKLDAPGYYEKLVGEIMEGVEQFPAQLNLEQQGLFAIGYYHQRQDHFKKK
jgi:CRISPR-associated protein Csd1